MREAVVPFWNQDQLDVLERASVDFERRLRRIEFSDWARPTPCADWTVRNLVNHVVGGNLRYVTLLAGAESDAVEPSHDEDVLGDDPLRAFAVGADAMLSSFREPGALDREVHHRSGDIRGGRLLAMRVADLAIHGWDLAAATDGDRTIDAGVTEWLNHTLPSILPDLAALGFYSSSIPVSSWTGQDRLLRLAGRDPTGPVATLRSPPAV